MLKLGDAAPLGPATLGAATGGPTLCISLIVLNPVASAAAAAIPPKTGPTIGIGAKDLKAARAEPRVSIVVCAIAAALPALLSSPNIAAKLPKASEASLSFCSVVSFSSLK